MIGLGRPITFAPRSGGRWAHDAIHATHATHTTRNVSALARRLVDPVYGSLDRIEELFTNTLARFGVGSNLY